MTITKKNKNKSVFTKLKCSPKTKKKNYTCYSDESLIKIKNIWNQKHPHKLIKSNKSLEIWKDLKNNLNDVCSTEACWLKQKFMENNIDKELMNYTFAPTAPSSWRTAKGKNTWLSSIDIEKVMKQYENTYKNFAFLGPSPIDFDSKNESNQCVWEELCKFNLSSFLKKNKTKIGIVFNTDPHTKGGSHWICMFIDIPKNIIYYFDSVGDKPPKQINILAKRIQEQGKKLNLNLEYKYNHPFEHQFGNTECGIYVIYFITEILEGKKDFDYFTSNKISDKDMEKYRSIYFN